MSCGCCRYTLVRLFAMLMKLLDTVEECSELEVGLRLGDVRVGWGLSGGVFALVGYGRDRVAL